MFKSLKFKEVVFFSLDIKPLKVKLKQLLLFQGAKLGKNTYICS